MSAHTISTMPDHTLQAVFDALVGWDDVEERLDVSDYARRTYGYHGYSGRKLDEAFLLRAGRHPRPLYRIVAVEFGATIEAVVAQGLRDRYWRVRWTAAGSSVAPPDLLAEMVRDTSVEVRCKVAGNPRTPLAALRAFFDDRSTEVRKSAAQNEALLDGDLRQLSLHPDPEVRHVIAGRSATPVDVLEALALDDDLGVAAAVGRNENASTLALHRVARRVSNTWTLEHIAVHPAAAVDDLLYLIDQGEQSVLLTMARRSPVPEALHRLAQMDDAMVRAAVVTNPALGSASLAVMPLDAPVAEHRAAAVHPEATWASCRRLAEHYLASSHPGRRNIGIEMVSHGLDKADAGVAAGPASIDEPFDVLFALFTGQRRDELIDWANGDVGPAWLRRYVRGQLGE